MRLQRLKADICFVYVVLCQDAAIFYESETAFLARTPQAARCQEKTFFSSTCLHAGKVAFTALRHMRAFFPAKWGATEVGRRQVPTADPRHSSFCSHV